MGTAIKHPVPDRVKPSFVMFDIRHSGAQGWTSECPDVKNYKWWLNPVRHMMFFSYTRMTTAGLKGFTIRNGGRRTQLRSTILARAQFTIRRYHWRNSTISKTVNSRYDTRVAALTIAQQDRMPSYFKLWPDWNYCRNKSLFPVYFCAAECHRVSLHIASLKNDCYR